MESKIRIRVGEVELEYAGEGTFSKDDLLDILGSVAEVYDERSTQLRSGGDSAMSPNGSEVPATHTAGGDDFTIRASVNQIASKLRVNDGPGLVMAAAAHLYFVQSKDTFTRKEILETMKQATNYFKESTHTSNLSKLLKRLVFSHQLIERTKDVYSLPERVASSTRLQLSDL